MLNLKTLIAGMQTNEPQKKITAPQKNLPNGQISAFGQLYLKTTNTTVKNALPTRMSLENLTNLVSNGQVEVFLNNHRDKMQNVTEHFRKGTSLFTTSTQQKNINETPQRNTLQMKSTASQKQSVNEKFVAFTFVSEKRSDVKPTPTKNKSQINQSVKNDVASKNIDDLSQTKNDKNKPQMQKAHDQVAPQAYKIKHNTLHAPNIATQTVNQKVVAESRNADIPIEKKNISPKATITKNTANEKAVNNDVIAKRATTKQPSESKKTIDNALPIILPPIAIESLAHPSPTKKIKATIEFAQKENAEQKVSRKATKFTSGKEKNATIVNHKVDNSKSSKNAGYQGKTNYANQPHKEMLTDGDIESQKSILLPNIKNISFTKATKLIPVDHLIYQGEMDTGLSAQSPKIKSSLENQIKQSVDIRLNHGPDTSQKSRLSENQSHRTQSTAPPASDTTKVRNSKHIPLMTGKTNYHAGIEQKSTPNMSNISVATKGKQTPSESMMVDATTISNQQKVPNATPQVKNQNIALDTTFDSSQVGQVIKYDTLHASESPSTQSAKNNILSDTNPTIRNSRDSVSPIIENNYPQSTVVTNADTLSHKAMQKLPLSDMKPSVTDLAYTLPNAPVPTQNVVIKALPKNATMPQQKVMTQMPHINRSPISEKISDTKISANPSPEKNTHFIEHSSKNSIRNIPSSTYQKHTEIQMGSTVAPIKDDLAQQLHHIPTERERNRGDEMGRQYRNIQLDQFMEIDHTDILRAEATLRDHIYTEKPFILKSKNESGQEVIQHVVVELDSKNDTKVALQKNATTTTHHAPKTINVESSKTDSHIAGMPQNKTSQNNSENQQNGSFEQHNPYHPSGSGATASSHARNMAHTHETLYQQVINRATEMSRTPQYEARSSFEVLTLNLGKINVIVEKVGSALRINFSTESKDSEAAIKENVAEMTQNLKSLGFENIEVSIDLDSSSKGKQQASSDDGTNKKAEGKKPEVTKDEAPDTPVERDFGYNSFEFIA
jgi:hypothetical protein